MVSAKDKTDKNRGGTVFSFKVTEASLPPAGTLACGACVHAERRCNTRCPQQGHSNSSSFPCGFCCSEEAGPRWQAGFAAAAGGLPGGQASGTYLAYPVDGAGEAVIGDGCVSGLDWPQGLTVRAEGEEPGCRLPSQAQRMLGPELQPRCQPSRPVVGMARETHCVRG